MPTLRTQLVLDDMKHLKDEFVMLVYTAATIVCTSLTGCWSLDVARWDNLSVSIAEGDTVTLTCRSPTPERRTRGSLGLVQGEDRGVGMVPLWDSGLQGEAVNRRYRITYRVSGPKSVLRLTIRDAKEEDSGSYGCLLNSDERTASYMTLNVLEDNAGRSLSHRRRERSGHSAYDNYFYYDNADTGYNDWLDDTEDNISSEREAAGENEQDWTLPGNETPPITSSDLIDFNLFVAMVVLAPVMLIVGVILCICCDCCSTTRNRARVYYNSRRLNRRRPVGPTSLRTSSGWTHHGRHVVSGRTNQDWVHHGSHVGNRRPPHMTSRPAAQRNRFTITQSHPTLEPLSATTDDSDATVAPQRGLRPTSRNRPPGYVRATASDLNTPPPVANTVEIPFVPVAFPEEATRPTAVQQNRFTIARSHPTLEPRSSTMGDGDDAAAPRRGLRPTSRDRPPDYVCATATDSNYTRPPVADHEEADTENVTMVEDDLPPSYETCVISGERPVFYLDSQSSETLASRDSCAESRDSDPPPPYPE